MNTTSPMILIGVGGAGTAIARGVDRAFGGGTRHLLTDTDARSGLEGEPFALIGGDQLAGRGSGGDIVAARIAAEDSVQVVDEHLEGVRLAVVVTALGGGTGGGATLAIVKHLSERGIPTVVFATTPFTFEGQDRQRNARGVMSMIEDAANATFFIPLDKLIGDTDVMDEAMRRAVDTLASGITLFWRLVEKPGYIALDVERIRAILHAAGRGRFATVTVQGPNRSQAALDALKSSEMLTTGSHSLTTVLCGVLAGEDLRLSEVAVVAEGLQSAFCTERCSFCLGTVNDEITFTGRLSVVAMLFEADAKSDQAAPPGGLAPSRRKRNTLAAGPVGRGRFANAEATMWYGEDLDTPTYVRRNINLDF